MYGHIIEIDSGGWNFGNHIQAPFRILSLDKKARTVPVIFGEILRPILGFGGKIFPCQATISGKGLLDTLRGVLTLLFGSKRKNINLGG
ncbi:hypothetical protein TDIS_0488 [Thermosulfurimonas dismutans]|uniref:Uncharacterized protein n=1 Tax=Thermosulfurimonas dismutans TaxID=999894 RepID=A0A179D6P3_9BACT|nr:hypothetical protein TDIS_0488 [Thermosulfurimonas dismutans]